MYAQRYWHEREFHSIEKIKAIVEPTGRSIGEHVARVGALANPAVTSAIIGASRPDQLDETLATIDMPLDPEIKSQLDDAPRIHCPDINAPVRRQQHRARRETREQAFVTQNGHDPLPFAQHGEHDEQENYRPRHACASISTAPIECKALK